MDEEALFDLIAQAIAGSHDDVSRWPKWARHGKVLTQANH